MKRVFAQHPSGQRTLWRIPAPKESPLVTAIRNATPLIKWGERQVFSLARTPAGEWLSAKRGRGGALFPTGYVYGAPKGWWDFTGFVPPGMPERSGQVVCVECKRGNENLTDEQNDFGARVIEAGGVAIVARIDWDVFLDEYLDAIGLRLDKTSLRRTIVRKSC